MKKIILDDSKCIGCGYCFSTATENFEMNDDGRATLINDNVTEDAIEASEGCPVGAISISKCNCGDNCECGDDCNCDDECDCKKNNE